MIKQKLQHPKAQETGKIIKIIIETKTPGPHCFKTEKMLLYEENFSQNYLTVFRAYKNENSFN